MLSTSELKETLDRYEAELERLAASVPDGPEHAWRAEHARIVEQVQGYARLRVTPHRPFVLMLLWPSPRWVGRLYVRTTPVVHRDRLTTLLEVEAYRITDRLSFALVAPTPEVIVGPPAAELSEEHLTAYIVPEMATMIYGKGLVQYFSGHELELDGSAPVLLPRLTADGLALRPGPVHCRFYGLEPAMVRIGNRWMETPHATSS